MSSFIRQLSLTAAAAGFVGILVAPAANATPADDKFLGIVANLGIAFPSQEEAVATGQEVCTRVANGHASRADPVLIRSSIVGRFVDDEGLSDSQAANLMWAAVDVYCPQYNSVVGD